jgi:hypothetical protein
VLAMFAEFERDMIRDRLREARATRRHHGLRSAGRLPFGYSSDPLTRQLIPDVQAATLVTELFAKAAADEKPAAIAAWANSRGKDNKDLTSPSRHSNWNARTVLRLLRNPVYAGYLRGRNDTVRGAHQPIISEEMFNKVQEVIAQHRTRPPTTRPVDSIRADPFLLRGLVTCSACERTMTTSASRALPSTTTNGPTRSASPDIARYYRCRSSRPCPGRQIAAQRLENGVVSWLAQPTKHRLPEHVTTRLGELMASAPLSAVSCRTQSAAP